MILLPTPVINFFRALQKLSDLIDDKFFPLPKEEPDVNQKKVEEAANFISRLVKQRETIKQVNNVRKMVDNLAKIYGQTVQVKSWQDSLHLDLYNKELQIKKY